MAVEYKTLTELFNEWALRFTTYTDEVTYFGENGVEYAMGQATAGLAAQNNSLHRALTRRFTLLGAQDDDLDAVLEEHGSPRRGGTRARVLIVLRPFVYTVTSITGGLVEVSDSEGIEVGDTLRIRSEDGSTTEVLTVAAITTATGPNGGDELNVGSLLNTYDPANEDVKVLLRQTITEGTSFSSDTGVAFESLADVTIGDLNPVLDGESNALSLNDKVWAECTTKGEAGNVAANTIKRLTVDNDKVKSVFNPERAFGGFSVESDFEAKRRAAHRGQFLAQETPAFMEALAQRGSSKVLRLFRTNSTQVSTIGGVVLSRTGGGLSSDERAALETFMENRLRSPLHVELDNVVPTAIEIVADITLTPGPGTTKQRLKAAWIAAADRLATFLDFRKWDPEQESEVDNSDLLALTSQSPGIATLLTSSFEPAEPVPVALTSVPILVYLRLNDTVSGLFFGADLTPEF